MTSIYGILIAAFIALITHGTSVGAADLNRDEISLISKLNRSTKECTITAYDVNGTKYGHIVYTTKKHCGWIVDLEVDQAYQRNGIGTLLFKQAIEDLKAAQYDRVEWVAYATAIKFYKRRAHNQPTKKNAT